MNWTGGNLQRTKKTGNAAFRKQKAYFARARTRLQREPCLLPHGLSVNDFAAFGDSKTNGRLWSPKRQHTRQSERSANDDLPFSQRDTTKSLQGAVLTDLSLGDYRYPIPRYEYNRKCDAADAGLEIQLLEANKKRLLSSTNWIGVSSLKPVNLKVESIKNKEIFGKRRYVSKSRGRRTLRYRLEEPRENWPLKSNEEREYLMGGAIQSKQDDIRIRFGTDALTTNSSAQRNHRSPSPASWDSMLLDDHAREARRHVDPTNVQHRLISGAHRSGNEEFVGDSALSFKGKESVDHHSHDYPQSFVHPSDAKLGSPGWPTDIINPVPVARTQRPEHVKESVTPGPPPVQHIGGERQSLRLTSDAVNIPSDCSGEFELSRADDGRTMHESTAVHAGASELGLPQLARCNKIDNQPPTEAAHSAAVLNEEPWRTFLGTSGDNSSLFLGCTKYERVHVHQSSSAENRMDRSRTRTLGTHRDMPIVQTSQCAVSPDTEEELGVRMEDISRQARFRARNRPRRVPEEDFWDDEKLWRNFVFGGLQISSPQPLYGDLFTQQTSSKGSSGYLPMSAAVSSIGASPSRPASRSASCKEGKIIEFAQASSSPMFSSPDARLLEKGMRVAYASRASSVARGAVRDGSVTHASLWNNAADENDSISTRMLSNTSMSRNEPRYPEQSISSTSRRAHPSGSITWRPIDQLSVDKIFDSEDGKLDLIDRDRVD